MVDNVCQRTRCLRGWKQVMDERDYDYWDFQDIKSEIGRLESEGIQCEGDFESLVETQHKEQHK